MISSKLTLQNHQSSAMIQIIKHIENVNFKESDFIRHLDDSIFMFFKSDEKEFFDTNIIGKEKYHYKEDNLKKEKKVIRCVFCSNTITEHNQIISVNGSHQHIFANPDGLIFNVGCFRECIGCVAESKSYTAFSWFHGYNWRVAGCNQCRQHLGWLFSADYSGSFNSQSYRTYNYFYSLILENIII